MPTPSNPASGNPARSHPFRRAVLRGLTVMLPPLLTVVIIFWIANTVNEYVLKYAEKGALHVIKWSIQDVRENRETKENQITIDNRTYRRLPRKPSDLEEPNPQFVPQEVFERVKANADRLGQPMPSSANEVYYRYVELRWLKPQYVIPIFLVVFILLLYLLGRFLAVRMGRFALGTFEKIIDRLPVIRSVYGSVKQVTDFVFSEKRAVEYTQVVAVEYPRKGIWSLGFVTGESMRELSQAAGEPVLSLLMPTSPMPLTGFTISVKKSETVELDITVEQAFQFIISCGVVVPVQQLREQLGAQIAREDSPPSRDEPSALPAPDAKEQ